MNKKLYNLLVSGFLVFFCETSHPVELKDFFYHSVADYAFDFTSERAVLYEFYIDFQNKFTTPGRIVLVDFSKNEFKEIASSTARLGPIALSPTQTHILFYRDDEKKAVLYDLKKEKIVITKRGDARLIHWNKKTNRFYLAIEEPKKAAYEYDFESKKFVGAPLFEFVTTRDSKGPYRLEFYSDDMSAIWSVIKKDTGEKVTKFNENNGHNKQDPLWSYDFQTFWFYPHSKLINISKRSTEDYLQTNRWKDISHNGMQVFVYDQDDEKFHVVDASTGKIQKTYEPFWRKPPTNPTESPKEPVGN